MPQPQTHALREIVRKTEEQIVKEGSCTALPLQEQRTAGSTCQTACHMQGGLYTLTCTLDMVVSTPFYTKYIEN